MRRIHSSPDDQAKGLERLVFFTDAVFAIAMTLLALEIHLPEGQPASSSAELLKQLVAIWPQYLAYVLSFLVIGFFWLGHHRKFRYIRRYDRRFLLLNLFTLMAIAFVPFPTSVMSQHDDRVATIFYASAMAWTGMLFAVQWGYAAHHRRLIAADLDEGQVRFEFWIGVFVPVVFLASIGVAYVAPNLARLTWILMLVGVLAFRRTGGLE
jgi:TMEM175 potassium channel family protein